MDDDYQLIPKSVYENLKHENKLLQKQIDKYKSEFQIQENNTTQMVLDEIRGLFEKDVRSQRDAIMNGIAQIKELNQRTLDNVLSRETLIERKFEGYDKKFDNVVSSFRELVVSVTEMTHEISTNFNHLKNALQEFEKLDRSEMAWDAQKLEYLEEKMNEVDLFMKNLRVLLSQIKPADMTRE